MSKEMTWRKAIEKVLSAAVGAVHYKDLTDKIIEENLRISLGATPSRTVNAHLTTAIKNEGEGCPFQKVGKGLFIWKACGQKLVDPVKETEEEDEVQYDIISSFGMFWRREAIEWAATSKILGMLHIPDESDHRSGVKPTMIPI